MLLVGLGSMTLMGTARAATGEDPTTAARNTEPNDALWCPDGACSAKADRAPPSFALSADQLYAAWLKVVAGQPRATLIDADPTLRLIRASERTPLFRFVDDVTIRVLSLADGRSSYAIWSRSRLGAYDFGVNARRLQRWGTAVERAAGKQ